MNCGFFLFALNNLYYDFSEKEQPVMHVREFISADIPQMIRIWNEIVEEGNAFPQEEPLTEETGAAFFAS